MIPTGAAVAFKNASGEEVPPGGVLEPDGTADEFGLPGMGLPTLDDTVAVVFNGPVPVPPGGHGEAWSPYPWAAAAVDPADLPLGGADAGSGSGGSGSGPGGPIPGPYRLGVAAGEWRLRADRRGFLAGGPDFAGLATVIPDPTAILDNLLRGDGGGGGSGSGGGGSGCGVTLPVYGEPYCEDGHLKIPVTNKTLSVEIRNGRLCLSLADAPDDSGGGDGSACDSGLSLTPGVSRSDAIGPPTFLWYEVTVAGGFTVTAYLDGDESSGLAISVYAACDGSEALASATGTATVAAGAGTFRVSVSAVLASGTAVVTVAEAP